MLVARREDDVNNAEAENQGRKRWVCVNGTYGQWWGLGTMSGEDAINADGAASWRGYMIWPGDTHV